MSGRHSLFSRLRQSVRPLFKITQTNHDNIFSRLNPRSPYGHRKNIDDSAFPKFHAMYDIMKTSNSARFFQNSGIKGNSRFKSLRSHWYRMRKARFMNPQALFGSSSQTEMLASNFLKDANDDVIRPAWVEFTKNKLIPLGNVSVDNAISIYHTGDEYYTSLWNDIANAKYQILMEIYIMEPDAVSHRMLRELTNASERGVSVTLIIDGLGSSKMNLSNFNELRRAGGIVLQYNQYSVSRILDTFFLKRKLPWIFAYRNHKKVCVIDDKIGYTGGMNMTGEYCSSNIKGGINKFRDTHCRLTGNVVKYLKESIYYSVLDIDPLIPSTTNNTTNVNTLLPSAIAYMNNNSENINNDNNNRNLSQFRNEIGSENDRNSFNNNNINSASLSSLGMGSTSGLRGSGQELEEEDSDTEMESILMAGELTDDERGNIDITSVIDPAIVTENRINGPSRNEAASSSSSTPRGGSGGVGRRAFKEIPTQMLPTFLQPFQLYSIQNYIRQSWHKVRHGNELSHENNMYGISGNNSGYNINESSKFDGLNGERVRILASTPRVSVKQWLELNKNNSISNVKPYGFDNNFTNGNREAIEKGEIKNLENKDGSAMIKDENENWHETDVNASTQPWDKGYVVPTQRSGLMTSNEVQTSELEASQLSKLVNEAKSSHSANFSLPDLKALVTNNRKLTNNEAIGDENENENEKENEETRENGTNSNVLSSSVTRQSLHKDRLGKKGIPLNTYLEKHYHGEHDALNEQTGNDKSNCYVQVLESYRDKRMRFIQKALRDSIDNAISHVFITNPYFLPPRYLKKSLIRAAKRGVDIRIITCDQCDVPAVAAASRHIYGQFLSHDNIRLFEYQDRVLHAKMVVIDDVFVSLGSFNWDDWSHKKNLELNLMIVNSSVGKQIHEQFIIDQNNSKEIFQHEVENRNILQSFYYWLFYMGSRLADKVF